MKNSHLPFVINFDRQPYYQHACDGVIASEAGQRIQPFFKAIFSGERINTTEQRSATHWIQRVVAHPGMYSQLNLMSENRHEGIAEIDQAAKVLERMESFVTQVRTGQYKNPDGQPYKAIVHLGIGGSDLGPRLLDQVFERLELRENNMPVQGNIALRFVANVDYHEQAWALKGLDPKTTLVVVASKSFSTRETLLNAEHIFEWLNAAGPRYKDASVVGVTCKPDKAIALGVNPTRVFEFSENIGGRYSLWGPVSISIRLVYGNAVFSEFLAGGAAMDLHALDTELKRNLPCLLAISDYINLKNDIDVLMLSPYDSRLSLLVPYLQQLWMESLGKGVTIQGNLLNQSCCPILWGDVGTNGQHAFFQMLHQAPATCAVELLAVKKPTHDKTQTHQILMSHFLAQAQAFSTGKMNSETDRNTIGVNHKTCPGGRPVTSMIMDELTPFTLGQLLSMWEHRTAALAALNNINPFDQWGVELGKEIAQELEGPLANPNIPVKDPVTGSLMAALRGE